MRVIKKNTASYEPFSKSLQYYTRSNGSNGELKLLNFENISAHKKVDPSSRILEQLFEAQEKIALLKEPAEIQEVVARYTKELLNPKEAGLFFYNNSATELLPASESISELQLKLVAGAQESGILDWVFESNKPAAIPELSEYRANGAKIIHLVFPIKIDAQPVGLYSVLQNQPALAEESAEYKSLQLLLGNAAYSIKNIRNQEKINQLYGELQTYQSKINNDYKVYAIGEMTEGLIEEIMDPLQVILSHIEFIEKESLDIDTEIIESIRKQIAKVRETVSRISKFKSVNETVQSQSYPSNLNKSVAEYINLIKTTLMNLELDCELDLDEKLPSVLCNPEDIKHLLTNLFSLIKNGVKPGNGIIIQTRMQKENVLLSFHMTDVIEQGNKTNLAKIALTKKILTELMNKNDGEFNFYSSEMSGTRMELLFPLRRKLYK